MLTGVILLYEKKVNDFKDLYSIVVVYSIVVAFLYYTVFGASREDELHGVTY